MVGLLEQPRRNVDDDPVLGPFDQEHKRNQPSTLELEQIARGVGDERGHRAEVPAVLVEHSGTDELVDPQCTRFFDRLGKKRPAPNLLGPGAIDDSDEVDDPPATEWTRGFDDKGGTRRGRKGRSSLEALRHVRNQVDDHLPG